MTDRCDKCAQVVDLEKEVKVSLSLNLQIRTELDQIKARRLVRLSVIQETRLCLLVMPNDPMVDDNIRRIAAISTDRVVDGEFDNCESLLCYDPLHGHRLAGN